MKSGFGDVNILAGADVGGLASLKHRAFLSRTAVWMSAALAPAAAARDSVVLSSLFRLWRETVHRENPRQIKFV